MRRCASLRDLDLRPLLDRVALHLQVQVAADQGQRRLQAQGLHEHQHNVLAGPCGIGMALDLLPEAQGCVLLEVWPGREHVGAQEAGIAVFGLVHELHIGLIPIRPGQVVLGGDVELRHAGASPWAVLPASAIRPGWGPPE